MDNPFKPSSPFPADGEGAPRSFAAATVTSDCLQSQTEPYRVEGMDTILFESQVLIPALRCRSSSRVYAHSIHEA